MFKLLCLATTLAAAAAFAPVRGTARRSAVSMKRAAAVDALVGADVETNVSADRGVASISVLCRSS